MDPGHAAIVIFISLYAFTLVFLPAVFYIVARTDDKEFVRKRAELNASFHETVQAMTRQRKEFEDWKNDLVLLKWPALRKICEDETGSPCECPTKARLAKKIWYTRKRREAKLHIV